MTTLDPRQVHFRELAELRALYLRRGDSVKADQLYQQLNALEAALDADGVEEPDEEETPMLTGAWGGVRGSA